MNRSSTRSASPSADPPTHHCPGCGASQRSFPRYPWHFCQKCLSLAEDADGRRLQFGNVGFSGGLYCKYADETDVRFDDCGSVFCLIHDRPVMVTEARFGGVVAQPIVSVPALQNLYRRNVNLTLPGDS
ncbi:hypothetical protein [Crateriforma conspicua]|uniref:ADP-ribosylglycohydrolase n=1 Tax=Crateriforma conspicua TaxID=2527996 RepID=A0A5C6FLB6_9PLAN|nr:hypothetical protein [Crateriforma conspicua]TWU62104.1 hypothetical protein V7x_38330 [Crateriforma conspicua]